MNCGKIQIFWFSPVYHTRQLAIALGESIASQQENVQVNSYDLTAQNWDGAETGGDDLAILAIPVYAGRVPPLAKERLLKIKGNGAYCVLLASYGNRAYDNALQELKQIAQLAGFKPIAAAACIARHTIGLIFAEGRPNTQDLAQIKEFGQRIVNRSESEIALVEVPGEIGDKPAPVFPLPQTVTENCVFCGHCWQQCPAGAITQGTPTEIDKTKCICCMRCVAICPEGARAPDAAFIAGIRSKLAPLCNTPKANEFFGA